ncbi:hypothetical protein CDAR_90271 [Caerostris darwini]|uniref:Uncharacterized protein n=1 Tax=Caerostris darwini TaxID=1538125 RepID=A0AAV4NSB1_9ARAC|nr:hypothetical protein CDAR_90271 [Caerostris darwini]
MGYRMVVSQLRRIPIEGFHLHTGYKQAKFVDRKSLHRFEDLVEVCKPFKYHILFCTMLDLEIKLSDQIIIGGLMTNDLKLHNVTLITRASLS